MPFDETYAERNRASSRRIRELVDSLTDAEMQTPVGEHWTVAIALVHIAFWDRRAMYVLDMTERDGKLSVTDIDVAVNDLSLPLWAAVPPAAAGAIAIETTETMDRRLETYPRHLLEAIYDFNPRWVVRGLHRNEHLDEIDAALGRR